MLGVPGSGKTYLAKEMVKTCPRVVYFDPHADYENVAGAILISPREFTVEWCAQHLKAKYFRIVIMAGRDDSIDVADEFAYVAKMCRIFGKLYGGMVLLADEVGDYKNCPALVTLHRNGHKDNVVTIFVSQRAVDIPLGCRATTTKMTTLLQDSTDDLDRLRDDHGEAIANAAKDWKPGKPPVVWRRVKLWH